MKACIMHVCTHYVCIQRSLPESCQETSYRDLAKKSYQDTSYGDIVQRHCIEVCAEVLPRDPLHRYCQENSYKELVERSHKEMLYRDIA